MHIRHYIDIVEARQYAVLVPKSADLASDFGRQWAEKLFGAEAIASLPMRLSGKHKGKPKGYVIWRKAIVAGWSREAGAPLAVGQLADAWIGEGPLSHRSDALSGKWLGRMQPLASAASAGHFFDSGRARWATEEAERQRAWDEERREIEAERSKP